VYTVFLYIENHAFAHKNQLLCFYHSTGYDKSEKEISNESNKGFK